MNDAFPGLKRVIRLARKELREILRDRRTIVTLVAMPLLIYPLMSVVFLQFSLLSDTGSDLAPRYLFATLTSAEERAFFRRLEQGEQVVRKAHEKSGAKKKPLVLPEFVPLMEGRRARTPEERVEFLERLKEAQREKAIHLIVLVPDAPPIVPGSPPVDTDQALTCKIIALSNSHQAQAALTHIEFLFAAANESDLKARLGLPEAEPRITLLHLERVILSGATEDPLASLIPLILILMTITGAVYPAIDLTAGERERGTLEILVAAPVSRFELLSAKYLSVMTVSMMTAIVNLICMAITVSFSGLFPTRPFSPLFLLEVFGLLFVFAAFFSAVLLCVTSFARSFKEAQAYLIPLMLASLTPGAIAMMPGLKLEGVLAVLPLVNIVLMARDLFEGNVEPVIALIVIVTTLLYALAALSLAVRVFGAESVLYSEQSSWADLLRRPSEPQSTATIPAMLWCLALMIPMHFGLVALMRAILPVSTEGTLLYPVLGVVLIVAIYLMLFGALPGMFMHLGRVTPYTGLGLALPRPAALAAGLLLGASLWPIQLALLAESGVAHTLSQRSTAVLKNLEQTRESIGWGVLALGIVPAIVEEFFFRGLLFNALKRHTGALVTIGASALLFGLAHVVLDSALGLERIVPTTVLGVILSAVCWRSGSLWPSLIQHVTHNTLLLVVALNSPGWENEVPWPWLVGGAIGAMSGFGLLCTRSAAKAPE